VWLHAMTAAAHRHAGLHLQREQIHLLLLQLLQRRHLCAKLRLGGGAGSSGTPLVLSTRGQMESRAQRAQRAAAARCCTTAAHFGEPFALRLLRFLLLHYRRDGDGRGGGGGSTHERQQRPRQLAAARARRRHCRGLGSNHLLMWIAV
jgi:hypothetical protein